ncbi:MAG: GNAT family N-acetyltransferase [Acidimicrobiales bacterium]
MTLIQPPNPPLAGSRVVLRPFRVSDAPAVVAACQDPDIPAFTMMPAGMTVPDAETWIAQGLDWWARGVARFAITTPPDDVCLGQIGVQIDAAMRRAEAFYWLDRSVRGRGLATEALTLVTDWAFLTFDVARVQLATMLDNSASQRVAERSGFQREGVLRAWEPVKDAQPDVVMFSRIRGREPSLRPS